MMSIGSRHNKNKQMKKKPDEEDVSLGLNLGVSVQLASLLARWQVQYQAPGRVNTANYKICQLDLGKETKREKIKYKKISHIYHVHLLGRGTARKGFFTVSCTCDPGLEQSGNSSVNYPKISNPCMIQNNNLFCKHVQSNLFLHLLD